MTVGLLLDTNFFLHFRAFEEIDWTNLGIASDVELVVCPVVVRELERHKYDTRPKIQKRARRAVKALLEILEAEQPLTRTGVRLAIVAEEPLEILASRPLDSTLPDDVLVAHALQLADSDAYDSVVIISDDEGVLLKSWHFKVACWRPTTNLRLQPPVDDGVRRLKRELEELRSALPKLSLRLRRNQSRVQLGLLGATDSPEPLEEHAARYAPITESDARGLGITEKDRTEYNEFLAEYHQNYQRFLDEYQEYSEVCRRSFALELELENDGGAPADDLDISVHLPSDWMMIEGARIPQPESPARPKRPRTVFEKALRPIDPLDLTSFGSLQPSPYLAVMDRISADSAKLDGPWISDEEDNRVTWHIRHLKHGDVEALSGLLVVLPSADTPGGELRYRLHASNLVKAIEGQIGLGFAAAYD